MFVMVQKPIWSSTWPLSSWYKAWVLSPQSGRRESFSVMTSPTSWFVEIPKSALTVTFLHYFLEIVWLTALFKDFPVSTPVSALKVACPWTLFVWDKSGQLVAPVD